MRRIVTWVDPYLLLLLLLTLVALMPLAAPGYFYAAHDGRHTVFYLAMFDASLRDGVWWPTWAMHHIQGYGYPTFLIQAPIGFYVGAFFVRLGAGYTTAVKLTWAAGFLLSAWGMYQLTCYWLRLALTGNADTVGPAEVPRAGKQGQNRQDHSAIDLIRGTALVTGLLYVFIPYHLVDIYVRAALNDTLLLAWFPWVLLAFDRLLRNGAAARWPRRLATAILLLAGTLLTHTFALISFAPLVATYVLFLVLYQLFTVTDRRWRSFFERTALGVAAGSSALLLCVAFLLPLFWEGRYLDQQVYVTDTYDFRRHFIQFGQYFSPFWGFGFSDDPVGANDGMSFQVGLLPLVLTIVGIGMPWQQPRTRWLVGYLATMTLALLFLMSPVAQPLWETIPALAVIQFPWRLLALVALLICPLAGLVLYELALLSRRFQPQMASEQSAGIFLVVILVVIGSYPYIAAQLEPVEPWREDGRAVAAFEREHPDMIAYTAWVQERPFTESVMSADYAAEDYIEVNGYTADLTRLSIVRGIGVVLNNDSRGSSFGGVVQLSSLATVRVNLYYFPGWEVRVDGQPAGYRISEQYGLIDIDVPPGEHRIDVRMGTTNVRRLGMGISAGALFLVFLLLIWPEGRRQSEVSVIP